MHVGVAHHLGWAVLVTASVDRAVADRRRVALIDEGLPAAPIHHGSGVHPMHDDAGPLDDGALADLAAEVRASVVSSVNDALCGLAADLPAPIESVSLRDWPSDFPTDIATLRRSPYESQADSVMYRQVIAETALGRGWIVHRFDARTIEDVAIALLGDADALTSPRDRFGAPWNKDHRMAFAAAIVATTTAD